ncbi:MAG: hypothetical protein P1U78_03535 [Alcanivoracaceae bacterium]|nr:hypothetical protein [Alcanivoracaceae bacterium]
MNQTDILQGLTEQEKNLLNKVLEVERRHQANTKLSESRNKEIVSEIVGLFKKAFPK